MSKIYKALQQNQKEQSSSESGLVDPGTPSIWRNEIPREILEESLKLENSIKRQLPEKSCRRILITSATKGEGKSTVALSLAVSISTSLESPTLLVDGDLRNPNLHEELSKPLAPGITDFVNNGFTADDIIQEVGIPHLSLISAGTTSLAQHKIITSTKFSDLLNSQKRIFENIIIDSPEILSYPDAEALGHVVDGALLVVKAGSIRREIVAQAKNNLERAKIPVLGVVLNQREFFIPKAIYNRI